MTDERKSIPVADDKLEDVAGGTFNPNKLMNQVIDKFGIREFFGIKSQTSGSAENSTPTTFISNPTKD